MNRSMVATRRELDGRVAIVTGAGRNIGRLLALELAAGGAGVVVNVRSNMAQAEGVVQEIEAAGGKALAVAGDVANPRAVEDMVAAAAARFGRIDYLINNAALRAERALTDMTLADWRKVLGVILDGAFNCAKACLPYLKESGAGTIINIGGMSGHTGSKHRIHVVTGKSGLVGMTRALAHELAGDRITVNLVVPGLLAVRRDGGAEPYHHSLHRTLFGDRGNPADIAAIVRFLCGPDARFINGQTIHVNGGAYFG
jgi:3-oxoacyl-[acyl-carrier protein] reductase